MARPSAPLISRELASKCALDLIDEHGLEELSLERLARAMGVRAPSLYHHFRNKDDILHAAADYLMSQVPIRRAYAVTDENWQDWLVQVSLEGYRVMTQRPKCIPLLVNYLPVDTMVAGRVRTYQALAQTSLPEELHRPVQRAVERLTYGWVLHRALTSDGDWGSKAAGGREAQGRESERDLELALRAVLVAMTSPSTS